MRSPMVTRELLCYKHVSKQEFGHMLLAIQDLLQYIYEETRENPEERQELYNFIHMIKG